MAFGKHLFLDMNDCNRQKLNDKKVIYKILDEIPDLVKMTKIAKPSIVEFREGEFWGLIGFIPIAESHISIHSIVSKGTAFVDVFACKTFDSSKIIRYMKEIFHPQSIRTSSLRRGLQYSPQTCQP